MRVSKAWLKDFETVMKHHQDMAPMTFGRDEIEECKQEARDNEAWALKFYPRAAAMIREMRNAQ